MDFLEPRKVYHRTQTDDFDLSPQNSGFELSSLRTQSSFHNEFTNKIPDESPLLNSESDPIREDQGFFSRGSFRSLRIPFVVWPTSLYGWRTGALTAALLAAISLLINFVVLIWLGIHSHGSSLVHLYRGDCTKVERTDLWVHLAINVLSTLLLGGSNYCMQCLVAPTRADIDRAHARGKFLDVGVPSVRNLGSVPRYKKILWWALGLSSVPLHLMYNSSFYKSIATNDYNLYFVRQDFVDGKPFVANSTTYDPFQTYIDPRDIQTSIVNNPDTWERLDKAACINAYATNFLDNRRNLVLVSDNSTGQANESLLTTELYLFTPIVAFDW
jgi:hypothetical protein